MTVIVYVIEKGLIMIKDFALNELDILKKEVEKKLEYYTSNPDEDADTIGTEIEYSERILGCIAVIHDIFEPIVSSSREDINYILNLLLDLNRGYPLTDLHEIEGHEDEWANLANNISSNIRCPNLCRFKVKVKDGEDEKEKYIYNNPFRFKFYNIITDKMVSVDEFYSLIKKSYFEFNSMINQLIPIEFPYNPKIDTVELYVEIFECQLKDDAEPVKSLAITHYLTPIMDRPEKIFKFYDITDGKLNEIDWRTYSTRRQVFAREDNEETENPE